MEERKKKRAEAKRELRLQPNIKQPKHKMKTQLSTEKGDGRKRKEERGRNT